MDSIARHNWAIMFQLMKGIALSSAHLPLSLPLLLPMGKLLTASYTPTKIIQMRLLAFQLPALVLVTLIRLFSSTSADFQINLLSP